MESTSGLAGFFVRSYRKLGIGESPQIGIRLAITLMRWRPHRDIMGSLGNTFTAALIVALFVLPAFTTSVAAQESPLPAVQLDCGADPVMEVHPNSYEDAILECTVTNPTSASEVI